MERDSFVFYKDWAELRRKFPRLAGKLINAIVDYGIYDKEPEEEEIKLCFELIKGQIDRDRVKYEDRAERSRINGAKSKGAPIGNQNARKQPNQPKQPTGLNSTQNNPEQAKQPKQPDNVNVNDNVNDNDNKEKTLKSEKEDAVAAAPAALKNAEAAKAKPDPEEIRRRQEGRKREFYDRLVPFVEIYGKEMIREFFDYWTEPNKSGTQWRFELEKTWDTARRLRTWSQRNRQFHHGNDTDNRTAAEQARDKRQADAQSLVLQLLADGSARQ